MNNLPERFTLPSDAYQQLRDLTKWAASTPEFIKDGLLSPKAKKDANFHFDENVWEWQQEIFNENVKGRVPDPEVDGFYVRTFRTTEPCHPLWAVVVDQNNNEVGEVLIYREL